MTSLEKINVHFMPGDGHGWALDEDRRQMRESLCGFVNEVPLVRAEVIHTPFWQGLTLVNPMLLKKAFVIANADNPPFFYFKQPEFIQGQAQVDLWIARSKEALKQFQVLGLPVTYIPYTIDERLFFQRSDKKNIRKRFGIPEEAYVIANFHRDSEGTDLTQPKFQKAPELMLAIFRGLQSRGISFHVLLGGPRRHWIRQALQRENISFTFVGKETCQGDDFGINILDRSTLNELINAADLMLVTSRWEGGPQSVMEAAASRCKILSTPVGLAHDILEPISVYHSISGAVDRIVADQERDILQGTLQPQWERWHQSHTTSSMGEDLKQLYQHFSKENLKERKNATRESWMQEQGRQLFHTVARRWFPKKMPHVVGWDHYVGEDVDLDMIFGELEKILEACHIQRRPATGEGIELIGWPHESFPKAKKNAQRLQWIVPSMPLSRVLSEALLIVPSVQDIVNLRRAGRFNPALALPLAYVEQKTKATSNNPLLIEEEDVAASMKIWKAMAEGRPIVYSKKSIYYEQIFHAGFAYNTPEEVPTLMTMAQEQASELRLLAHVPNKDVVQKALRQLFMQLLSNH